MDTNSIDEKTAREYLLGTLAPEAAEEIEQRVLTNDNFAALVEQVEDRIIEDYLDGALPYSARRAMETHFLRPPERRRQLAFARLLRAHLQKADSPQKPIFSWLWERRTLPIYGLSGIMAALLMVSISLGIHSFRLQRALDSEAKAESQLKAQLALQQAGSENQSASLQNTVVIKLIQGITRDNESIPLVKVCPGTEILEIAVSLIDNPSPFYRTVLRGPGLYLSHDNVKVIQTSGTLKLHVPAYNLSPGQYELKITGSLPDSVERSYTVMISKCS